MFMKLFVNVFERAKSKITSTRTISRISADFDDDLDTNISEPISSTGRSVVHQQRRSSLSKWLCTTPASADKLIAPSKLNKIRRSGSCRSLKERRNKSLQRFSTRTLSVDKLHWNDEQYQADVPTRKQKHYQSGLSHSPIINFTDRRQKSLGSNGIRLSNCNAAAADLSRSHKRFNCLSSKWINHQRKQNLLITSLEENNQQIFSRNNTSSRGGDSGYSEESFAVTTSPYSRPFHTSCPYCRCEQRSSFTNYRRPEENSCSDSSTSHVTIHKQINPQLFHNELFGRQQPLSASRSYPHIKPLPKTIKLPMQQQRRTQTIGTKRRRHFSCEGSFNSKAQAQQFIKLRSSPMVSELTDGFVQGHFPKVDRSYYDSSLTSSKTLSLLPKVNDVFDELNLTAIELDSLRTFDCHRSSSSSSSLTSLSSLTNVEEQFTKSSSREKKFSRLKGTYLVWHEYKNTSLLSTTNEPKLFSVTRGDRVRLLRRIDKLTLLVQKEGDGSVGFLPQSSLADDQVNTFLSVEGLKETVL